MGELPPFAPARSPLAAAAVALDNALDAHASFAAAEKTGVGVMSADARDAAFDAAAFSPTTRARGAAGVWTACSAFDIARSDAEEFTAACAAAAGGVSTSALTSVPPTPYVIIASSATWAAGTRQGARTLALASTMRLVSLLSEDTVNAALRLGSGRGAAPAPAVAALTAAIAAATHSSNTPTATSLRSTASAATAEPQPTVTSPTLPGIATPTPAMLRAAEARRTAAFASQPVILKGFEAFDGPLRGNRLGSTSATAHGTAPSARLIAPGAWATGKTFDILGIAPPPTVVTARTTATSSWVGGGQNALIAMNPLSTPLSSMSPGAETSPLSSPGGRSKKSEDVKGAHAHGIAYPTLVRDLLSAGPWRFDNCGRLPPPVKETSVPLVDGFVPSASEASASGGSAAAAAFLRATGGGAGNVVRATRLPDPWSAELPSLFAALSTRPPGTLLADDGFTQLAVSDDLLILDSHVRGMHAEVAGLEREVRCE